MPPTSTKVATFFIDAFPISRMRTLGIENGLSSGGSASLSAISVMLGLGLLTLPIGCANYANLATAQSFMRNKEIGMRRTLGAGRLSFLVQRGARLAVLPAFVRIS